jgi:hypothetical protein
MKNLNTTKQRLQMSETRTNLEREREREREIASDYDIKDGIIVFNDYLCCSSTDSRKEYGVKR